MPDAEELAHQALDRMGVPRRVPEEAERLGLHEHLLILANRVLELERLDRAAALPKNVWGGR